jgi:hypothetical protein
MIDTSEIYWEKIFYYNWLVQRIYCAFFLQGMSEDVSIGKFFDEAMMVELAQQAADLHQQMI